MLLCDEYLTPRSLEDAFDAMARNVGRFKLVAGATDLLPWAREGRAGDVTIPVLIDIARIPELTERRIEGGRVRIGAATVFQRFLTEPELVGALPEMPRCAVWFADDQIRESATIGSGRRRDSAASGSQCRGRTGGAARRRDRPAPDGSGGLRHRPGPYRNRR
jgi:carbon-monoxide dehydrogenase medium subunit/xanthine dehydrogenase FAD-binding subunit